MPVDKFGRMSDAKTRDTGMSLTYTNNNYIRSDGGTSISGSINMNGITLYNVSDPVNPQDVATKEYTDNVNSFLNKSLIRLTQLYITLSRTQVKNKENINKKRLTKHKKRLTKHKKILTKLKKRLTNELITL